MIQIFVLKSSSISILKICNLLRVQRYRTRVALVSWWTTIVLQWVQYLNKHCCLMFLIHVRGMIPARGYSLILEFYMFLWIVEEPNLSKFKFGLFAGQRPPHDSPILLNSYWSFVKSIRFSCFTVVRPHTTYRTLDRYSLLTHSLCQSVTTALRKIHRFSMFFLENIRQFSS